MDGFVRRDKLHRGFEILEEEFTGVQSYPLNGALHTDLLGRYFPKKQVQPQIEAPSAEEIKGMIAKAKKNKAPGPSGLTAEHLQYLSQSFQLENLLASVFKTVLETPTQMEKVPNLYLFHLILAPKDEDFLTIACIA